MLDDEVDEVVKPQLIELDDVEVVVHQMRQIIDDEVEVGSIVVVLLVNDTIDINEYLSSVILQLVDTL